MSRTLPEQFRAFSLTWIPVCGCTVLLSNTVVYLFIYYKIVHTVQDRQNGQSNIKKSCIKAK